MKTNNLKKLINDGKFRTLKDLDNMIESIREKENIRDITDHIHWLYPGSWSDAFSRVYSVEDGLCVVTL